MAMPTEGPLAQDPHAIVEIMRAIWSDFFISDKDALTVPLPFREDLFQEGRVFRIGYYTTDGFIDPLPGNQRIVREAVELLKAKGHELVPFSLGDIPAEASRGIFAIRTADGGARAEATLKDEPLSPLIEPLRRNASMSVWTKKLFGWIYWFSGDKNMSDFYLYQSNRAIDINAAINRFYASRKRLVKKMRDENIEVILCPTTLSPAVPHSLPTALPSFAVMSAFLWNIMDFPAVVVTTGSWTRKDEEEMGSYEEKGLVDSEIKRGCRKSVGIPLSVQMVAPSFRDEMILRVMIDLYDEMKKRE
ncbi:hypothetical protein PENTCL1PPCAC_17263, partial [Pristionchus entomophagus]